MDEIQGGGVMGGMATGLSASALPPLPPLPRPEAPVYLSRIFAGLLLVVAAFDICFWRVEALGFSLGVFALAGLAAIALNRRGCP